MSALWCRCVQSFSRCSTTFSQASAVLDMCGGRSTFQPRESVVHAKTPSYEKSSTPCGFFDTTSPRYMKIAAQLISLVRIHKAPCRYHYTPSTPRKERTHMLVAPHLHPVRRQNAAETLSNPSTANSKPTHPSRPLPPTIVTETPPPQHSPHPQHAGAPTADTSRSWHGSRSRSPTHCIG